jgi:hypothetical protein
VKPSFLENEQAESREAQAKRTKTPVRAERISKMIPAVPGKQNAYAESVDILARAERLRA